MDNDDQLAMVMAGTSQNHSTSNSTAITTQGWHQHAQNVQISPSLLQTIADPSCLNNLQNCIPRADIINELEQRLQASLREHCSAIRQSVDKTLILREETLRSCLKSQLDVKIKNTIASHQAAIQQNLNKRIEPISDSVQRNENYMREFFVDSTKHIEDFAQGCISEKLNIHSNRISMQLSDKLDEAQLSTVSLVSDKINQLDSKIEQSIEQKFQALWLCEKENLKRTVQEDIENKGNDIKLNMQNELKIHQDTLEHKFKAQIDEMDKTYTYKFNEQNTAVERSIDMKVYKLQQDITSDVKIKLNNLNMEIQKGLDKSIKSKAEKINNELTSEIEKRFRAEWKKQSDELQTSVEHNLLNVMIEYNKKHGSTLQVDISNQINNNSQKQMEKLTQSLNDMVLETVRSNTSLDKKEINEQLENLSKRQTQLENLFHHKLNNYPDSVDHSSSNSNKYGSYSGSSVWNANEEPEYNQCINNTDTNQFRVYQEKNRYKINRRSRPQTKLDKITLQKISKSDVKAKHKYKHIKIGLVEARKTAIQAVTDRAFKRADELNLYNCQWI